MKKNKKGFVLVESIVAAVFVMAFSTFLIANLLPLVGEYEKSLKFDTVDAKYDAHLIRKIFFLLMEYLEILLSFIISLEMRFAIILSIKIFVENYYLRIS